MYFALSYTSSSHKTLEEAEALREQFEKEKNQWLSWDKWSSRETGLFKLESEGTRAIALCSKCYFVEDKQSGKAKMSSKGMSKAQNKLLWKRYEMALEGHKNMATKRGFRMKDGAMYTYEQRKLGLSTYYDKRWVLPYGIHTEPIEFHTANPITYPTMGWGRKGLVINSQKQMRPSSTTPYFGRFRKAWSEYLL